MPARARPPELAVRWRAMGQRAAAHLTEGSPSALGEPSLGQECARCARGSPSGDSMPGRGRAPAMRRFDGVPDKSLGQGQRIAVSDGGVPRGTVGAGLPWGIVRIETRESAWPALPRRKRRSSIGRAGCLGLVGRSCEKVPRGTLQPGTRTTSRATPSPMLPRARRLLREMPWA